VAQFTIKWPNGAELTYEGDVAFDELLDLLDRETPTLLAAAPIVPRPNERNRDEGEGQDRPDRFDFPTIEARFQEVQARTDVERVTVLAQIAIDAGMPGLDITTAENIYRELGQRMPGNWRSTFSNAQTRGYLRNVERGVWRTTAAGENFARRGERRPSAVRRRTRTREGAASSNP
jgi:hypothetical protein